MRSWLGVLITVSVLLPAQLGSADEYYLVLGSFKNPGAAQRLLTKVQGVSKLPHKVDRVKLPTGTYYRVVTGPLAHADELLQEAYGLFGIDKAWWISLAKVKHASEEPEFTEIQIPVKPPAIIRPLRLRN